MKKSILILGIFIVLNQLNTLAQNRLGYGAEVAIVTDGCDTSTEKYNGFAIGGFANYKLGKRWFAEGALRLSNQNVSLITDWYPVTPGETEDKLIVNTNYWNQDIVDVKSFFLELPVRLGYRIPITKYGGISFAIGPIVGVGLTGTCSYYTDKGTVLPFPEKGATYSDIFSNNGGLFLSTSRIETGVTYRWKADIMNKFFVGYEYRCLGLSYESRPLTHGFNMKTVTIGYLF